MMGSGFVLSVPVFFDTAFYLLVPLARSLYKTTGRHYLKYLVAIAAGRGRHPRDRAARRRAPCSWPTCST